MTEKTQKKAPPIQKNDEAPDFFELLREQHGNSSTYMRFYIQEDKYSYSPIQIQNPICVQSPPSTTVSVSLPINQLIYSTINDVIIENKFVYANSKIMNSILDSGRDIQAKHSKKHFSWIGFMNRPEFRMIKSAYESLKQQEKDIIEYSVLAISNLVLKLGINISKLSCILTQRKHTTKFLSIPTLSILFLQNLMNTMFTNREIKWEDDEGKSQYIRQLPKVTYIKVSEFINKHELLLMEIGEYVFFTSQAIKAKRVKNTQYFQFYEEEQMIGMKGYERITHYEHIHAVNTRQLIGRGAPYGFEFLLMFRMVYFPLIKEFNPDAIIFVEDYDNSKTSIEPEVRALLLSEMMENITGKVFVMREVGLGWGQDNLKENMDFRELKISKRVSLENCKIEQQDDSNNGLVQLEDLTVQRSLELLQALARSLPQLCKQTQQKLDRQQEQVLLQEIKNFQILKDSKSCYFAKVHSVLKADLAYISLALIQRQSFDQIAAQSHRYQYPPQFIQNLIGHITPLLNSIDKSKQLKKYLSLSKEQLNSMIENMNIKSLIFFPNRHQSVYILPYHKSFILKIKDKGQQVRILDYQDQDHLHVFYGSNQEILVFRIHFCPQKTSQPSQNNKFRQNTLCLRLCITNQDPKDYFFKILFHDQHIVSGTIIHNPTFLITNKYIYRAFGRQKNSFKSQNPIQTSILKAGYRHLLASFNQQTNKLPSLQTEAKKTLSWQSFNQCSQNYQHNPIPLIEKEYGWAVYDQNSQSAIFAGGYTPHGESRVNKYMHVFWEKETKIKQMGKTSSQIFDGLKFPKAKIPLFPFIYGISFQNQNSCILLNTNGFFQCFTNCNKLFLTELRTSQNLDKKNGILWQRKLFTSYENEQERLRVVATKQFVIHMIVNGYKMVNSYKNTCILQTLEDGIVILTLDHDKSTKNYSIKVQRKDVESSKLSELLGKQKSISSSPLSMQIQQDLPEEDDKFAELVFRAHDI